MFFAELVIFFVSAPPFRLIDYSALEALTCHCHRFVGDANYIVCEE